MAAAPDRVDGILLRPIDDTLVFQRGAVRLGVLTRDVVRVERHVGTCRWHPVGALAGSALGALGAWHRYEPETCDGRRDPSYPGPDLCPAVGVLNGVFGALTVIAGGAGGTLVGVGVGYLIRTDRWEVVGMPDGTIAVSLPVGATRRVRHPRGGTAASSPRQSSSGPRDPAPPPTAPLSARAA